MKTLFEYIKENNNQKMYDFIDKIEKILKDNEYKSTNNIDKIYSTFDGSLYYFKDFDNIYISYINNKQYGKLIIFNNNNCQLLNIDNKTDNQIEIISCDINDKNDLNSFLIDFENYITMAKSEELLKKQ